MNAPMHFLHWFSYVLCFFAGTALTSGVPRSIKGICGEPFPASFGWTSPVANVLEGIFDLFVGGVLFVTGHASAAHPITLVVFFAGVAFASVLLSHRFGKPQR